jgi:hypothetical protein
MKELNLESAFTHVAKLDKSPSPSVSDSDPVGKHGHGGGEKRMEMRRIPVERSGGGT